ncbi:GNAT family N-acetyltransferase [Vibrio sp. 16]|uniref:GNAT family N-acetyltransferase n=1 Tax=Vibrio sp. 16 TaxID=391586 RepID=UPI00018F1F8F|nr:GNAT family N-acetyltransferase [Vibrio sp. 16]EED28585.1 ATPase [Vibrio sp. 16]CAK4074811.1 tRNA(Met) cytidine acetyltransferase TmcA [Vibrio sp. 16]
MNATHHFLSTLTDIAGHNFHRYGVVLNGQHEWQVSTAESVAESVTKSLQSEKVFQLGGEALAYADLSVGYNKGQQLLGQECGLLICDLRSDFDANSFSAALGCLRGGGLLLVFPPSHNQSSLDGQWLQRCLANLYQLYQNQIPNLSALPSRHASSVELYQQQNIAVEKIRKVVEGHRKRPLVMVADRGRGKSSALGIAAAQLLQTRAMHILVCAPTLATVQPIFQHAERLLDSAQVQKGRLMLGDSVIEFIAPDDLLKRKPNCDCLFVDEASAIPIPMLQQMVAHYHRTVFSTTVHGYEGCGRGFTVKFQTWLQACRPGTQTYALSQPIRWNESDPLEGWLFETFLLDAELENAGCESHRTQLSRLDKQTLLDSPHLLRSCFALLVNAHYQTSPNDLLLLLNDDTMSLYATFESDVCVGCLLVVEEGGLDAATVSDIQQGRRRPKGQLVASSLASQLGISEAAIESSLRIMRIAVHPELQGKGIGQEMVAQLQAQTSADFYSTSFGATSELVHFWRHSGFSPVKLGSSRDHASGTHSLLMVSGRASWIPAACDYYRLFIQFSLSNLFQHLESDLVRSLVDESDASVDATDFDALIQGYLAGGAQYDSIAPVLDTLWKRSPQIIQSMSDLLVAKIVQQRDWSECARLAQCAGRKHVEAMFKQQLEVWINQYRAC